RVDQWRGVMVVRQSVVHRCGIQPRNHRRRTDRVGRRFVVEMPVIRSTVVKSWIVAACCAVLVVITACSSDSLFGLNPTTSFSTGTTTLHQLDVGELTRSYELYVPTKRPMAQNGTALAYPLLIVLHGSGASGDDMREMTRLDSIAESLH